MLPRTINPWCECLHHSLLENITYLNLSIFLVHLEERFHSLDYDYSFSAITNTGDGGLAVIEMYSPPVVSTFQGNRVIGRVFTHCVVQRADENLEWSPPITLSQTKFARCVDITVDGQGTIWAVYGESSPLEGTYVRTSEDCSIWSEPIMISFSI